MPQTLKRLGQVQSGAGTNLDLYVPAAGVSFVCSCIVVCNTDSTAKTYRIFTRRADAAGPGNAIAYDVDLSGNGQAVYQLGIAGNNTDGDIISVEGSATGITFTAYGQELS